MCTVSYVHQAASYQIKEAEEERRSHSAATVATTTTKFRRHNTIDQNEELGMVCGVERRRSNA